VTPDTAEFAFEARTDGAYWFDAVEGDVTERLKPNPNHDFTPAFKVLVDTTPPVVRITEAKRDGDKIHMTWASSDKNPKSDGTKLWINKTGRDADWQYVDAPAGTTTTTFGPGVKGKAQVKVTVTDAAGNEGTAVVTVE